MALNGESAALGDKLGMALGEQVGANGSTFQYFYEIDYDDPVFRDVMAQKGVNAAVELKNYTPNDVFYYFTPPAKVINSGEPCEYNFTISIYPNPNNIIQASMLSMHMAKFSPTPSELCPLAATKTTGLWLIF